MSLLENFTGGPKLLELLDDEVEDENADTAPARARWPADDKEYYWYWFGKQLATHNKIEP